MLTTPTRDKSQDTPVYLQGQKHCIYFQIRTVTAVAYMFKIKDQNIGCQNGLKNGPKLAKWLYFPNQES